MHFNVYTMLVYLPAIIWAQEAAYAPQTPAPPAPPAPPPPADLVTITQTSTTTFTHTVTISLIATATIMPPQVNNTMPKSGYLTATESGYGPVATDVRNGDSYNLPELPPKSPPKPKETATITPASAASSIVGGDMLLISTAGLLAVLVMW